MPGLISLLNPAIKLIPVAKELAPVFLALAQAFRKKDPQAAKRALLELEAEAEIMALEKLRGG